VIISIKTAMNILAQLHECAVLTSQRCLVLATVVQALSLQSTRFILWRSSSPTRLHKVHKKRISEHEFLCVKFDLNSVFW